MPDRTGFSLSGALRYLSRFWHDTLRPADYPRSERDWLAVIGQPVSVGAGLDWGLAFGIIGSRPESRHSHEWRLRMLIEAYESTGDPESAVVLAALVDRGIRLAGGAPGWDVLLTPPASFSSGPPYDVDGLLAGGDAALPPRLPADTWIRLSARQVSGMTEHEGLDARHVAGLRVLVVALRVCFADDVERWGTSLYRAGARRVGLLALGTVADAAIPLPQG